MRSFEFKHLVAVMCTVLAVLALAATVAVLCNLGPPRAVDGSGADSLLLHPLTGDLPDTIGFRMSPWTKLAQRDGRTVCVVFRYRAVVDMDSASFARMPGECVRWDGFAFDGPDTLFIVSSWDFARVWVWAR